MIFISCLFNTNWPKTFGYACGQSITNVIKQIEYIFSFKLFIGHFSCTVNKFELRLKCAHLEQLGRNIFSQQQQGQYQLQRRNQIYEPKKHSEKENSATIFYYLLYDLKMQLSLLHQVEGIRSGNKTDKRVREKRGLITMRNIGGRKGNSGEMGVKPQGRGMDK